MLDEKELLEAANKLSLMGGTSGCDDTISGLALGKRAHIHIISSSVNIIPTNIIQKYDGKDGPLVLYNVKTERIREVSSEDVKRMHDSLNI